MRSARLRVQLDVPERLELVAHGIAGDVTVAGQLVWERAHVAGALHVVLAAQRVHADAGTADIAGRHRQIGDRDHGGRTLAVLGDAEPVIDRAIAAGGVDASGFAQVVGIDAGEDGGRFRAVLGLGDERRPFFELGPVAALAHEGFVDETFGDDDMRQRRHDGDVGAGHQGQMQRLHVRRFHHLGAARIDHDQLRALAQPLLQAGGEHRMGGGRVGADDHGDVGILDRVEILRAGGGAEGDRKAIAGRGVADARAGVDIVVAEAGADQLLHQIGLFVGAAGRGDAADGVTAVFRLDAAHPGRGERERFIPGHFAPGILDPLADHRIEDALLVIGVAPGEAALDAGMAAIGLAVLVGHHAHDFLAAHLGLEGAADAAIGAGGDDGVLGLADLDHGFFRRASQSGRPARRRRRRRIRSRENSRSCRARRGCRSRGRRSSARRCLVLPRRRGHSVSRRCTWRDRR